ncbi:hypothetical protein GCM10009836_50090 [Pseudonocardia ailaonensis]|uniref:Polyketide cyclase n=1 Tax=Pseudonocardia ailaonensis TaxID=367279 RepID=A0ABN2NCY6_9PSEU
MDTSRKIAVSKVVGAPAGQVFAVLSDPGRHREIDGAGMLQGVEGEPQPLVAVGQTFAMNMHQDALGDYRMINKVTALMPDARIGWSPALDPGCELAAKLGDMEVGGHTFTYDLSDQGDGTTKVTQTYEWMSVKDEQFLAMLPVVSENQLSASLDRLDEAVR